jgi:predicted PurR-regulated permease PerM
LLEQVLVPRAPDPAETSFLRRVWMASAIVLGLAMGAALLVRHPEVPLLVFGAILGAVFLDALARPVRSWLGASQAVAVGAATVVLLAATAATLFWMGPRLYEQGSQLVTRVPELLDQLQSRVPEPIRELQLVPSGQEVSDSRGWQRVAPYVFGSLGGLFSTTAGILGGAIAWLALSIFLAMQPELYRDGALLLLPPERRDRLRGVLGDAGRALRWWLVGRGTAMAIVALLTGIALALLGIPLVLPLALLAGVLTFVPYVGPLLAAAPAVLVALSISPTQALIVAALYWGIQLTENYVVTPLVQGRAVSLPPALLLVAQVALGILWGGLGLLLSTPITVAGIVLVQALYLQDVLGERVRLLGEPGPTSRRAHRGPRTVRGATE